MGTSAWRIAGRYRSYEEHGTIVDAARAVLNLVNVQGPGMVAVLPFDMPSIQAAIDRLDPTGSWRSWWQRAAGEPLQLTASVPDPVPIPHHTLRRSLNGSGRCLGINVGGHFLRFVLLVDGVVAHSSTIRLGTGKESPLSGITVAEFVRLIKNHCAPVDVACIGIAWSAPRTTLGLRAMSILMDDAGELAVSLHAGDIDTVLSREIGLPVYSWNDGEASAAAEATFATAASSRPLLVLKLGTSMASGLANGNLVAALPIQLAKCLLKRRALREYRHPAVGVYGTARDLIGAESLTRTYRDETSASDAKYEDFCAAAVRGEQLATRLLADAVAAVAELAEFVSALWSPVHLVVTGKNLEHSAYRAVFTHQLRDCLNGRKAQVSLLEARCDQDLVAAIGAICLSLGCLTQRYGTQSTRGANNG